jgi:hypothetical protein
MVAHSYHPSNGGKHRMEGRKEGRKEGREGEREDREQGGKEKEGGTKE